MFFLYFVLRKSLLTNDYWQTNCCVYQPALVLRICKATYVTWPKKQAIIWFAALREWTTFVGFRPLWNIQTLDFCCTNRFFDASNDVATSIKYLGYFLAPFNTGLFLSFGLIMRYPTTATVPYRSHLKWHECFRVKIQFFQQITFFFKCCVKKTTTKSTGTSSLPRLKWYRI